MLLKTFLLLVTGLCLFSSLVNAACLNNYNYKFQNEWAANGGWKTNGVLKPNFNYRLRNWRLEIEFAQPLIRDFETVVTKGWKGSSGKSNTILTAVAWNKILNGQSPFEMSYFVVFKNRQGRNHIVCAQFCGTRTDTGEKICDTAHVTTRKPTTPAVTQKTTRATTQKTTRTTTQKTTRATTQKTTRATTLKATRATTQKTTRATTQKTTRKPTLKTTKRYTTVKTTRRPTTNNPTTKKSTTPTTTTTTPSTTTTTPTTTTTTPSTTTTTPTTTTTTSTTPSTTTTTPTTTTTTPTTTTTTPTTTTTTTTATTTTTQCAPKYNYAEVLEKSLLFYEAQRSGKLPEDQRVKWRHDSTLTDGVIAGKDLTGGYFDAGDYVKFGFPMAATITNLAWGMLEFKKGYTLSGQYEYGLKAIKWGTDYFIKCHPEPNKFYGQVGDGNADHGYWGPPEKMELERPSFFIDKNRPGSDLAGETAAALAASSLVFKDVDSEYSEVLLQHAKELYNFAMTYKKKYSDSITDAANFYRSWSGFTDELAWASVWLYRTTGDNNYKTNFFSFQSQGLNANVKEFSWDNKWLGAFVLAEKMGFDTNAKYLGTLKTAIRTNPYTPKGMIYIQQWGTLRHAANLAFLARVASTMADKDFYNEFARSQIHYMLGDAGRSYVVGFGNNPPQRPHHRSSSCPVNGPCKQTGSSDPNPVVLHGALVGGPDNNDNYADYRGDFVKNEVACDYNAGFQSAIAGLIQLADEGQC
uniref:Endoglucanase n=1 Tax=Clytia hemisphaerica TaxID=252671 RepID=A0A7M5UKP5_9CNID